MTMNSQERLFTIQQLSLKFNIPKPTLRFWEKELGGIIAPLRTSGGQRRYTSEHISKIEKVQKLKREGLSLTEIKRELHKDEISDNSISNKIDLLANRIAEVVKEEISSFFQREDLKSKGLELDEP